MATTKVLSRLRNLMKDSSRFDGKSLLAYIIPSSDAHGSEYICECDKRRQFISGFSGSAGTAVVTEDAALLWTDGRYFLSAAQELDTNWTLMKDGLEGTPSISTWLSANLPKSSLVGIDARLYEESFYSSLESDLNRADIKLYDTQENLVDLVWDNKPTLAMTPLLKVDLCHSGKRTSAKLKEVRDQMRAKMVYAKVVTSLDDTAWLLNLRGSDVPYNTVFFSYCIITDVEFKLFVHLDRLTDDIKAYLLDEEPKTVFYDYDEFYPMLRRFYTDEILNASDLRKVWLCTRSSHAIHQVVNDAQHAFKDLSFVSRLKIIKNESEIESSKQAHIRDSLALCEFFHWIEKKATNGNSLDGLNEYNVGQFVDETRGKVVGFLRPSFETICSTGPNAAIIHYKAQETTCKPLRMNDILLLDSGGHYSNAGTTDVTRTVFLGNVDLISDHVKECFTRVLKGHIQLAMRVFPNNTNPVLLDSFARQALWDVGLNYGHGTGHGVGFLLNVHEIPFIGTRRTSVGSVDIGLQENMIMTIEPGYYEEGQFGIRIENCNLIVQANTEFRMNGQKYLTFEPLTYVPIQRELIKKSIMTAEEIVWLNNYHEKCRLCLCDHLLKANENELYAWLIEKTQPI